MTRSRLTIWAALSVIFSVLLLAACGGGSSRRAAPAPAPVPDPAGTASGTTIKGIIREGDINIQEVLSDGSLSESLGSATTDAGGAYSAEISEDYSGGPLKITLSANASTTMLCDAPSGCGGAAFGEETPLAEGFELVALVTSLDGDTVSVHVTPITDMAARLAENDPDGLSADAVAEANDVVRQTFSLPGDITLVEPVDLTDPAAVAAADPDSQKIALLSAGILEAVQQTDAVTAGGSSFEDAINQFTQDFADQGGLVLNDTAASEGAIVSLGDILAGTSDVLDSVVAAAGEAGVDPNLEAANVDLELAVLQIPETPSDDPNVIEPLDTATADSLNQAKALIGDLRDLSASAQLETLENELSGFGDSIELAFAEQVDLVTGVVSNDLGVVIEALAMVGGAFEQTLDALEADPALTLFDALVGGETVSVAIEASPESITLSVDQTVAGVSAILTAEADAVITESVEGNTEITVLAGSVAIAGTAANDEFTLSIGEGSQIAAEATQTSTETNTVPADFFDNITAPSISADLLVTITADQAGATPVFDGELSFALTDSEIDASAVDDMDSSTFRESVTFGTLDLALTGSFGDTTGNSVGASLSISAENSGEDPVVFELTQVFQFDPVLGFTVTETETGETADNFVAAEAVIGIDVALPGIDTTTALTINLERTGLEDGEGTLTLVFNGKTVEISGNTMVDALTISNQDNVVANIEENLATGLVEGSIAVGELEVATIEENEDGIVIVRYEDNSFEALGI